MEFKGKKEKLRKDNPWLTEQNQFDPELWEGLKEKLSKIREENLTRKEHL